MRYIYGPLKSRRLGFSLGVSLTPYKICNFDCIYCQLGKTDCFAAARKEFVLAEDVIRELKVWLENRQAELKQLNFITISGAGEPTLSHAIGEVISSIKKLTNVPVAVITNASLLNHEEIRKSLLSADLIVPSLDAAAQEVFAKIDRPYENIKVGEIIQGLVDLRKEFIGKIWLEVMIVSGLNDDLAQARKLKKAIERIKPDKIQINSPVRVTTEKNILPASNKRLEEIKEILGDKCEII